jgi:hypothetical protein
MMARIDPDGFMILKVVSDNDSRTDSHPWASVAPVPPLNRQPNIVMIKEKGKCWKQSAENRKRGGISAPIDRRRFSHVIRVSGS